MRNAAIALLVLLASSPSIACDCVPEKMRAQGAMESLAQAKYAVHARVIRIGADGKATLQVLDSFKGPQAASTFEITPTEHQCGKIIFSEGEKAFVISFGEPETYCSKYAPEPFMLDAFRKAAAK